MPSFEYFGKKSDAAAMTITLNPLKNFFIRTINSYFEYFSGLAYPEINDIIQICGCYLIKMSLKNHFQLSKMEKHLIYREELKFSR